MTAPTRKGHCRVCHGEGVTVYRNRSLCVDSKACFRRWQVTIHRRFGI